MRNFNCCLSVSHNDALTKRALHLVNDKVNFLFIELLAVRKTSSIRKKRQAEKRICIYLCTQLFDFLSLQKFLQLIGTTEEEIGKSFMLLFLSRSTTQIKLTTITDRPPSFRNDSFSDNLSRCHKKLYLAICSVLIAISFIPFLLHSLFAFACTLVIFIKL